MDEDSGQSSYKQVLAHYSNPYKETVYVTIKSETGTEQTIVSNKIHPFFTVPKNEVVLSSEGHIYKGSIKGGQWDDAKNLKSGYKLLDSNNQWQEIVSVVVKPEPLQAYNLTVDQTHTYFIKGLENSDGVWVHNSCVTKLPKFEKSADNISANARDNIIRKASNYHGRLSSDLEKTIISYPDNIFIANNGRFIFHKGEDVVIIEGQGSKKGQVVTSYGSSGPRGESGAAIFGGKATDPGKPITAEMISDGTIPTPSGENLPPAIRIK